MVTERIDLEGDSRSLTAAINAAAKAFKDFDATTARIVQSQRQLTKTGDPVIRTLTLIDSTGRKVTATVSATAKGIDVLDASLNEVSATTQKVVEGLSAESRQRARQREQVRAEAAAFADLTKRR